MFSVDICGYYGNYDISGYYGNYDISGYYGNYDISGYYGNYDISGYYGNYDISGYYGNYDICGYYGNYDISNSRPIQCLLSSAVKCAAIKTDCKRSKCYFVRFSRLSSLFNECRCNVIRASRVIRFTLKNMEHLKELGNINLNMTLYFFS